MSLFFKECKNILKSYIYYVFIAITILFYISQMGMKTPVDLEQKFAPPERVSREEEYATYGLKEAELSEEMIPEVAIHLYREYIDNSYVTYPIGYYKEVKLNKDETKEIELILEEITGNTIEELDKIWNSDEFSGMPVNEHMSFERFKELMEEADKLLGGGSNYGEEGIKAITRVPVTYEEAIEEYEYLIEKDKLTNGYARLFSDYLGIVMGIFPIFVAVFMSIKDRKTKMSPLIYSRNTSSSKIILTRFFSLVFMMLIPIIVLGIKETATCYIYANSNNIAIDVFAFIKYIVWWLLPTLMMVTSIGMFFTLLTDTPIAIAIGLFMWFSNLINIGLKGDYPILGLFVRHNSYKNGILIAENFSKIMTNRLLITGISLLIVGTTICIYESKRSGKLDMGRKMGKLFSFNKDKHKTSYSK